MRAANEVFEHVANIGVGEVGVTAIEEHTW